MIEPVQRQRLFGQALFIALFVGFLFVRLVPMYPGRVFWPGPDLGVMLALVWVLRRPEQVPVLVIALLFLIEDIMLMRPVGLWAAIVVMGTEAARLREPRWRELPFMVEWLRVSLLLALMMFANRVVLSLFLLPLPPLGQAVMQFIATCAAYPLLAGLMRWPLGYGRIRADADTRHH